MNLIEIAASFAIFAFGVLLLAGAALIVSMLLSDYRNGQEE